MFHLQCAGCGTSAYVDCVCPAEVTAQGVHLPHCKMTDPDAQVVCPPGSGCCQEDHDHAAAANACPGDHGDCPEPQTCKLHQFVKEHRRRAGLAVEQESCSGGHCHKDLEDCTVCRSLVITAVGTAATLQPAAGG